MKPLTLELRHSTFRFTAPVLAVVAFAIAASNAYPRVASWTNIVEVFVTSSLFAAPFLAGLASWEALRSHRRGLEASENTAARPLASIRAPQYFAVLLWVVAATLLTGAAIAVRAAAIGLSDRPDPVGLLVPFLTNAFSVTVGFAVAAVIRRWIAIVVAIALVIALYSIDLSHLEPYWLKALSPLHALTTPAGTVVNSITLAGQACVTLAGIVALVAITTMRNARRDSLSIGAALVGSGALAFFGWGLVSGQNGLGFVTASDQPGQWMTVHTSDPNTTLRVLKIYEPVAPELAKSWGRVSLLFGKSDLHFTRLQQDLAPTYGVPSHPAPTSREDLSRACSSTSRPA